MKSMQARMRFGGGLILASLGTLACGAEFESEGEGEAPAGSEEAAIIGGSAVSISTQRTFGLVDVNGCSGALITPDWVLTATHCVKLASPVENQARVVRTDGAFDTRVAAVVSQVAQTDMTLLKLASGKPGNMWPTTVRRLAGATGPNIGQSVTCYGHGATGYASPSGVTGGGLGIWRSVTRNITNNNGNELFVRSDNGNNILAPGDSGGSCLFGADIAGVVWRASERLCADPARCNETVTKFVEVSLSATAPFANYINSAPSRAATTFFPIELNSGWKPAFRSNVPAAAYLDGVVYLRGAATTQNTTGSNSVVFTLPPIYSPSRVTYVPATLCGGTKGRLRIEPTGETIVETMAGEWSSAACLTSFDGVKFGTGTLLSWTTISLRNGWSHEPFGTRRAAARRRADGWVHLQGAIAGGSSPLAFTLAPAFSPQTVVYVPVDLCSSKKGRLTIMPSGDVTIETEGGGTLDAAQCFTSLEGVSFFTGSTAVVNQLTPLNGWTGAPFSTRSPGAINDNGVVRFIGAVTPNGSSNPHILTLPAAMRPAALIAVPIDMCRAQRGRLVIQEDGRVFAESTQPWPSVQCFASLEGVSFGI
jgi:hypothetical protein